MKTEVTSISITKALRHAASLACVLLVASYSVFAQTGEGSTTVDNSTVVVEPGTVELRFSETTYFGPDAHWIINGTLEIWSSRIWIAPTARITGSGKIIIHDPGTNPYYEDQPAGPTHIDGNRGEPIGVAIELRNANNLVLADIADPGYGTVNPAGTAAAALVIGANLEFAVDGADVLLNGHDLLLGALGTLSGYSRNRMIVTGNRAEGHVSKIFNTTNPFTFPVGIAEGDYTPATLSPAEKTTLYVSVQDYRVSEAAVDEPEAGMDRVWHIYADGGVYTGYLLQHNSITNGSAYVDERAQLVQYAGSGNWMGGNTQRLAQGVHARSWVAAAHASANDSWLTKLVSAHSGPQAVDDKLTGPSGNRLTVVVLENDLPGDSPIDVASVRVVVQPRHGTVFVNSDGSITYISNPKFMGEDTYMYEVTDQNGLKDLATVRMDITYAELLIPNAVTPNGDGRNDLFVIQGLENYENADLTIFNRWGNEVYRSHSYQQDWDAGGLSDGTYYYRLVLRQNNVETMHSGWVLVKRQ